MGCGHKDMLMMFPWGDNDSKYKHMRVCGSNFNRSSMNQGHTDSKQTDRLFTLYSIYMYIYM